jgi:3-deoxy-7-phosphoheptulonate synthase
MVVVMAPGAPEEQIHAVVDRIESTGSKAFVSRGVHHTIIGVVGDPERCYALNLPVMPGVSTVLRVSAPYKLVSAQAHSGRSVVHVGPPGHSVPVGPNSFTLIAGPPVVESAEQTLAAAQLAAAAGATILFGGTFNARLCPYTAQGLGEKALTVLAEVREATGLAIAVEVVDPTDVELVATYADMIHVGSANMQNLPLLDRIGRTGLPISLTRSTQASLGEWLMAAEYLAQRGNLAIILCDAGIRTFETVTARTLDLAAVPLVQQLSHLPVIVHPSQASGRQDLVVPLARAAIAAGADGLLVDVHPEPENALHNGQQCLAGAALRELASAVRQIPRLLDRSPTVVNG